MVVGEVIYLFLWWMVDGRLGGVEDEIREKMRCVFVCRKDVVFDELLD